MSKETKNSTMKKVTVAKKNIYECEGEILQMTAEEAQNDPRLPGLTLLVEKGQKYVVTEKNEYVVVPDDENPESVNVSFVYDILDNVLRDVFRRNELGQVILPFVVLRRIDCCLEAVNEKVRDTYKNFKDKLDPDKLVPVLLNATTHENPKTGKNEKYAFYNTSNFSLTSLLEDPANIDLNFKNYLNGFNKEVLDILENYHFDATIVRLIKNDILFALVEYIVNEPVIRPDVSDDIAMGYVFEEIIRLASEENNEEAGQHFTPRDAIRLMSALMFEPVKDDLNRNGIIRSIYDPTCGTGGMVNVGKKYILNNICDKGITPTIKTYGQELNDQSYAIAKSEALITNSEVANIQLGNTLTNDKFVSERFSFIMANPPYGTTWKKDYDYIFNESINPDGRFYAGLPRTNDGQLLFIQHMLSKMSDKGSRVGCVTSGSPLFTGGAGSGESNIRRWIIDNDYLEAIIALPTNLFYNAGIGTYIWIMTNNKEERRKGKIQLINAVNYCQTAKKSLGDKRKEITREHIDKVMALYNAFENKGDSKVFDNKDFGFLELTIEQPKRKENGEVEKKKGQLVPDTSLRFTQKVKLKDDPEKYFKTEVLPHIDPESWIDIPKTRFGYEINFSYHFYEFGDVVDVTKLKKDIKTRNKTIADLVNDIFED